MGVLVEAARSPAGLMSLRLDHPLALLLLLAVGGLAGLAWRLHRPPARGRRLGAMLLPGLALVLVVLALSAPQVRTGSLAPTTLAVDRSASIDAGMRAVQRRWRTAASSDDCVVPCRAVQFAAAPDALGDTTSPPGVVATDLESAISTAIGLTPTGGRVVLLSDGGQTDGDMLGAAGLAEARHVRVDWVPLSDPHRRDAAIAAIHVPAAVRVGDEVPLALTVHSSVAGPARLSIRRDGGAPASQTVHLSAGDTALALDYTATRPGFSSFTATISLPGDAVAADNSAAAVVDVAAAPRVLVVSGRPGSPVPDLLAARQLDVGTSAPAGLPVHAGAYAADDAVVLDDIPATQLSSAQVAALDSAVRTGGLGLVVLGGPDSFSEGRYWGSRLQQILPVRSLKPGNLKRRNLAVELVLDHSGSMIDLAGGAPKIAEARASAVQAAAFIASHRDELGIIDFDVAPHTLVPLEKLAPGAQERAVDAKIATLQASGGTNIYAGLEAGFRQLLTSHAPQRHLILVTDGISAGADYGPLLALLRREKISVATVALGSDADRPLLAQIAKATGGHNYVTDNADDLPRILIKETQESAKPVRVTGRLAVTVTADSPVVRSLAGAVLPALSGNEVVTLKPGAQADLSATGQGSEATPTLSEWQIGAGRVLAWTPGLGAPWALSWLAETALWNDAVRWSARGIAAPQVQPVATPSGSLSIDLAGLGGAGLGVSGLVGSLTGADGIAHRVSFTQVGPALYRADVARLAAGVYRFALSARGATGLTASGQLALPYPAEYSPVTAETSPLAELVAQTGGRILAAGDPGALAGRRHGLAWWLALAALVAFLAGVAVRMTARVRPAVPAG